MKIVYVCSPYRGDTKRNKQYARELTEKVLMHGDVPITPHLYITECLDDNDETLRNIGLHAALNLLTKCDIILVGNKYGITDGMAKEIEFANILGISIQKEDVYL